MHAVPLFRARPGCALLCPSATRRLAATKGSPLAHILRIIVALCLTASVAEVAHAYPEAVAFHGVPGASGVRSRAQRRPHKGAIQLFKRVTDKLRGLGVSMLSKVRGEPIAASPTEADASAGGAGKASASEPAGKKARGSRSEKKRVLIVDDDPLVQDLVDAALTMFEGHKTVVAAPGETRTQVVVEAGLELIDASTDLSGVVIDGLDGAWKTIATRAQDMHLPCCVVSGDGASRQAEVEDYGIRFFHKPLDARAMQDLAALFPTE